jgi:hypothetical protein
VRSIRRRLNEIGLYGRKPAKKPFTSAQNRSAQLQFAKEHLNWTPRQWKNIVFSDETKFNFYSSDEIPGVPSLVSHRKMTLKLNYIYMKVL